METINGTGQVGRHYEIGRERVSVSDLCYGMGILVCTCLILYFCVMTWGSLSEILLLRFLNFFILLGGILFAFKLYSRAIHERIDYFTGLKIGIRITLIAVIPFALFIALFLSYDSHLMQVIQHSIGIGEYLNPVTAAGAVCMEGISSGLIITFAAMQYFKSNEDLNN